MRMMRWLGEVHAPFADQIRQVPMEFAPVITANPSLLVISSCLRSGWSTFDPIFVPLGPSGAMPVSCAMALSRDAPQRMSRLVHWFYDRRMVQ
jgi:hypothetical protein